MEKITEIFYRNVFCEHTEINFWKTLKIFDKTKKV